MGRRNIMTGTSEQFQYILRDESMHLNFGVDLVNAIIAENPHLWTDELKAQISQLIDEGVTLEYRYAEETMPNGILGLNKEIFKEYLHFVGNRRLSNWFARIIPWCKKSI